MNACGSVRFLFPSKRDETSDEQQGQKRRHKRNAVDTGDAIAIVASQSDPTASRRPAVRPDSADVDRPVTSDPGQAATRRLRYRTQDTFRRPEIGKLSRIQGTNRQEHRLITPADCIEARLVNWDFANENLA